MSIETRHRSPARWVPDADPDRKNLETLLAFAYGLQMGHLRRISDELTQLARQAKLATMATGAAIAVEHQQRIECIARSGDAAPQLGSRPAANVGLAGECLRTGQPQFCGDTETHPFVDRMHSRTFGLRSIVYVPVFRGARPEGVVGVFGDKPNQFTPQDVRALELVAREVSRTLRWETPAEPAPQSQSSREPQALPAISVAGPQGSAAAVAAAPVTVPEITPLADSEPPVESTELSSEVSDAQELADFDWKRSEDPNYPARATNYLFSEEHPLRRWASIGVLAMALIGGIVAVWWAVPRFTASSNIEPTADYINRRPPSLPETPSSTTAAMQYSMPYNAKAGLRSATETTSELTFVRDVRTLVNDGHVFVTIHLSGPVQFQTQQIPERIYLDLHGVQLSPLLKATQVNPVGPIAQFRFAPTNEPGVIRMAMVLDAPCTFLVSVTSNPQAIILDVQPQRGIRPAR